MCYSTEHWKQNVNIPFLDEAYKDGATTIHHYKFGQMF